MCARDLRATPARLATGRAPWYTPAGMARSLTFLLILALPAAGLAQGKLDQVREAVDKPAGPSASSSKDKDQDDTSATSGSGDSWGGWDSEDEFRNFFLTILAFPWTMPHEELDLGRKIDVRFAPHPYPEPATNILYLDRPREGVPSYYDRPNSQWWSVRASAEAGSDFDGLDRVGLRLFLDTNTRFGLKSDWDWYTEKLPCGCRDTLWIGDLTATYRFVQNEWLLMHTGLGARFLLDAGHDRGGLNFLYGFDAFPVQPVHLFGSFEAGTLGSAGLVRLRGGVGVNCSHAELFAGYDFVRIGGLNLQGPMVGLRVWF
jgi:hypothetical protein